MKNNLSDNSNLLADLMEERVIDEKNYQKEFFIDMNFYKTISKDFYYAITTRFCSKKCLGKKEFEVESKSKKNTEELKCEQALENIYNCCGQQGDFIQDDMPLGERIFRVFLKYKNKPLNTHKISQELNYYNLNYVFSLLTHDNFYGFKEVN